MLLEDDSLYTVYMDEGGDPGVTPGQRYKNLPNQWMTLGAFVIRSSQVQDSVQWLETIRSRNGLQQGKSLHYNKLSIYKGQKVCNEIGRLQARTFCLASYKENLRGYNNPKLGHMSAGEYYNWCARLILERVMFWASHQLEIDNVSRKSWRPLRLVFSQKGGHDYEHMFSYFENLNIQAATGTFKKPPKCWDPALMHRSYWGYQPDFEAAGLQFADAVASSFLNAANSASPKHNTDGAWSLRNIVARDRQKRRVDCGVTLWPLPHQSQILESDRKIFAQYGYVFR